MCRLLVCAPARRDIYIPFAYAGRRRGTWLMYDDVTTVCCCLLACCVMQALTESTCFFFCPQPAAAATAAVRHLRPLGQSEGRDQGSVPGMCLTRLKCTLARRCNLQCKRIGRLPVTSVALCLPFATPLLSSTATAPCLFGCCSLPAARMRRHVALALLAVFFLATAEGTTTYYATVLTMPASAAISRLQTVMLCPANIDVTHAILQASSCEAARG